MNCNSFQELIQQSGAITPSLATLYLHSYFPSSGHYCNRSFSSQQESLLIAAAQFLIAQGANIDPHKGGIGSNLFPINSAIHQLSPSCLQQLLILGIDFTCPGARQKTALQSLLEDYLPEELSPADRFTKLELLLEYGAEVGAREIAVAIRFRYLRMLCALLKKYDLASMSDCTKLLLWEVAITRADVDYLNMLKNDYHLQLPTSYFYKTDLALTALIYGTPAIIRWLIDNISLFELIRSETLVDVALELGNIAIARELLLSQELSEATVSERLALWIEQKTISSLLSEELDRLFIFSENTEIKKINILLANRHPEIAALLHQAQAEREEWGAMIARYGSIALSAFQVDLHRLSVAEYFEQQREFGRQAVAVVKSAVKKISNNPLVALRELFREFSSWHAAIAQQRRQEKMAYERCHFRDEGEREERETPIGNSLGDSVYSLAVPLVEKTCKEVMSNGEIPGAIFRQEPFGYTLIYCPEGTERQLTMGHVFLHPETGRWMWQHDVASLMAWEYLEYIHEKILLHTVDLDSPETEQELHALIAKGFWLGANIMITCRGNGLYMRMLMAVWYSYHNMSFPLASLTTPLLDIVALSIPLQKFIHPIFFLSHFSLPAQPLRG